MAVQITVIDRTGNGQPPGTILLEGKFGMRELREKALQAVGLRDFVGTYKIEVLDEKNEPTKRITSTCIIFVSGNGEAGGLFADLFGKFGDMFEGEWPRF
jgi:hypothetical protein